MTLSFIANLIVSFLLSLGSYTAIRWLFEAAFSAPYAWHIAVCVAVLVAILYWLLFVGAMCSGDYDR